MQNRKQLRCSKATYKTSSLSSTTRRERRSKVLHYSFWVQIQNNIFHLPAHKNVENKIADGSQEDTESRRHQVTCVHLSLHTSNITSKLCRISHGKYRLSGLYGNYLRRMRVLRTRTVSTHYRIHVTTNTSYKGLSTK